MTGTRRQFTYILAFFVSFYIRRFGNTSQHCNKRQYKNFGPGLKNANTVGPGNTP